MIKIFVPSCRQEVAPYGHASDVEGLLGMPCPSGYIAQGFMEMNRDLAAYYHRMVLAEAKVAHALFDIKHNGGALVSGLLECQTMPDLLALARETSREVPR